MRSGVARSVPRSCAWAIPGVRRSVTDRERDPIGDFMRVVQTLRSSSPSGRRSSGRSPAQEARGRRHRHRQAARLIDGRGRCADRSRDGARRRRERIAAVGANARRARRRTRRSTWARRRCCPGLIDLHTHLTGQRSVHLGVTCSPRPRPATTRCGARATRAVTLRAGFTTVRDMGPTWPFVDVDLRDAIDAGAVPGPRMMVAGNYVLRRRAAPATRGSSRSTSTCRWCRISPTAPDEIVKAVRTNFKNGADFIKILATGAVLSKGHLARRAAILGCRRSRPAVDRGRRAGAAGGVARARRRAASSAVDQGRRADRRSRLVPQRRGDRAAEGLEPPRVLRARRCYTRPSRSKNEGAAEPHSRPRSASGIAQIRETEYGGFKRALARGHPDWLRHRRDGDRTRRRTRRSARCAHQLGEPPMACIVAATSLNAEIVGWSDRVGSVEPGKFADLPRCPATRCRTSRSCRRSAS
mgnify:CR=1 FL=1